MLALPSLLISFLVSITIWNRILSYLSSELGHYSLARIVVFVVTLIGWIVTNLIVLLGIVYLLDFLTFPLQARLSIPTAIVTPLELKIGGLRHVIRLQVDESLGSDKSAPLMDRLMTGASTRRGLDKLLRLVKPSRKMGSPEVTGSDTRQTS